jgi:hypothetical protein
MAAFDDVVVVEGGVIAAEDGAVVGGAVAHLVVRVHLAACQQHADVGQQIGAEGAELRQRRHCGRAHGRVLENHSVVDEADVARGLLGAWTLLAQQVQDAHRQAGVLAVLNELAKVRQACKKQFYDESFLRYRDGAICAAKISVASRRKKTVGLLFSLSRALFRTAVVKSE